MKLSDFRREYSGHPLEASIFSSDPFEEFGIWFQDAVDRNVYEPNAMSLATADATGAPTQRCVLLKHWDPRGLVFFSNYESRKAQQIEKHPAVSALFPWLTIERQVSVRGSVSKCSREESETYFRSRPRDSQIGAWASAQSTVIESRQQLEESYVETANKFSGQEIPRPPFWGGYRIAPVSFEFWQGGPARLHDRFLYRLTENGSWSLERLSP